MGHLYRGLFGHRLGSMSAQVFSSPMDGVLPTLCTTAFLGRHSDVIS